MTAIQPPFVVQALSHPADVYRRLVASVLPGSGIIGAGDLAVAQHSTPNMSVDIAAGTCVVAGSQNAQQGSYHCVNDGLVTLAVTAANATNPRRDIVVAQVQDAAYSGAINAWSLAVIAGTPNASPVDPTLPANSLALARIAVAANATSITSANITDLRTMVAAAGPRGTLGYAAVTANQVGNFSASTDVTGLTTTVVVGVGRRIRITGSFMAYTAFTTDIIRLRIYEGATLLQETFQGVPIANNPWQLRASVVLTPTTGSHAYKIAIVCSSSNSCTLYAGVPWPAEILVDDIGT